MGMARYRPLTKVQTFWPSYFSLVSGTYAHPAVVASQICDCRCGKEKGTKLFTKVIVHSRRTKEAVLTAARIHFGTEKGTKTLVVETEVDIVYVSYLTGQCRIDFVLDFRGEESKQALVVDEGKKLVIEHHMIRLVLGFVIAQKGADVS